MGSPSLVDNGRHRGRARLSVGMPQGKLPVPSARRHEFSWQTRAQRVSASRRRRRRERLRSVGNRPRDPEPGARRVWGTVAPSRARRARHSGNCQGFTFSAVPEPSACPKHKLWERGCTGLPACLPRDPSLAAERGAGDNSHDDRDYGRAVRGRRRTCRSVPHRLPTPAASQQNASAGRFRVRAGRSGVHYRLSAPRTPGVSGEAVEVPCGRSLTITVLLVSDPRHHP
jgi:hypothetical protein